MGTFPSSKNPKRSARERRRVEYLRLELKIYTEKSLSIYNSENRNKVLFQIEVEEYLLLYKDIQSKIILNKMEIHIIQNISNI